MRKTLLASHVCCSRAGSHFFASSPLPAATLHCFTNIFLSLQTLKMKFLFLFLFFQQQQKKMNYVDTIYMSHPDLQRAGWGKHPRRGGGILRKVLFCVLPWWGIFNHIKRPPWEKKIHTHKYIQTSLLNHRKNELVLLLRIRQSQGTACWQIYLTF